MGETVKTGQTRLTANKKGQLVLQIEERYLHTEYVGGSCVDTEWVNRWRDARVEDLDVSGLTAGLTGGTP